MNLDIEVPKVVVMGYCADAWDAVGGRCQCEGRDRVGKELGTGTYGSAIRRSVSLMILFGKAMMQ